MIQSILRGSFAHAGRRGLGMTCAGLLSLCVASPSLGQSPDSAHSPHSSHSLGTSGEDLGLDDFAVGRALIPERGTGLQSVFLDLGVYRRSVEPGLADLRVFDGRGLAAPYAIRRRVPERVSKQEHAFLAMPLFALDARPEEGGTGSGGDYRLDAELTDTGAIVRVHRDGVAASSEATRPTAWLLDASQLERTVSAIQFDFVAGPDPGSEPDESSGPGAGDFVSRFELEASDDLARWKVVAADIVVARLAQGEHRIEQSRFDLPATRARYFRLTPRTPAVLPRLAGVRLQPTPKTQREGPPRAIERVVGAVDPESPRVVVFDLGGAPSIESLRVILPIPGTIVDGRLESSASPLGPWTERGRGLFYHYEREGLTFRNSKREWGAGRHRYVRLVTTPRGGGLQGQVPELEVEWVPDQLVYLERGDGESTLAIGRLGARDASFTPNQLLQTMRTDRDVLRTSTAALGAERVLAGNAAVEAPPEPLPWRTYGLWALLIAIVGFVMGLGFRLLRSQDAAAEPAEAETKAETKAGTETAAGGATSQSDADTVR